MLKIDRAVLRHPRRHVVTNAFAIEEHLLHPSGLQLRSDQRERRRDATVIAELQFAAGKVRVVRVMHAAEVLSHMTSDAAKGGQRFRQCQLVGVLAQVRRRLCSQCDDDRLKLLVIEIETRAPTARV